MRDTYLSKRFRQWVWNAVALLIAAWGGFFSLGLWSAGISVSGRWKEGAFLGLVLFAVSIGLGAMVHLLARLAGTQIKQ
ncbi:MAG: hypothetical protein KIT16_19945 [Rhodospirillaceae bacterium]|nr:hypothetical protein [Rhodospirillaceae bacterium]